jgi:exonuclease SbcC
MTRLARALANAKDLARVLDETAPRHRALSRARREADRQRTRLKKARADLRRATRRDRQLEGEHDQLATRLSLDALRRDLHRHRHDLLAPDASCPLCGAEPHAHGEPEAAASGALDRAEKRLEKIAAQRAKLAEKRRALQRAEDEAAAQEREAKERAAEHEKAIAAAREQWQARREALTLIWLDSGLLAQRGVHRWALLLPESPDRPALAELTEQLGALERALESEAHEDEARAAEVERLRHVEAEAERAAAAASEQLDAALERERSLELELQLAHQSRATAAADREAADRELRPRLSGWSEAEARLDADPGTLGSLVRPAVERLRAAREASRTSAAAAERAHEARSRADADLWSRHRSFETVRARVERARTRHAALARERATKLGGRSAAEVASELEQAVAAARAAAAEAEAAEQEATSAEAAAQAVLHRCAEAKSKAEVEADARAKALDLEIERSGLPRDRLEDLFSRRPEDLEAERAQIEALRDARARAQTTMDDRRSQAEATATEGLDEPTARAKRDAARSALEIEGAAVRELDGKLTRDDEARAKRDALAPELAALESRLATARELSALIGSADGKRLRTFAQGLTLEALVERANLHLERLRPRYRLVRAAGQDIDLRVLDRDLGDEVRAVATLSGGETFLVSLALALGLSGLSSRDVRVESMFIDEGFGHLDRDSLELALATLDELQAEGRTIGIVSHVPDLAERIGYVVDVQPTGPGKSRVEVRAV